MSAVADTIFQKAEELSEEVRRPFPASRKIPVDGPHGVRVPMREISLSATRIADGLEPNPPVTVYDTSGPYTDPDARIDLAAGLPALREGWIEARGDTEQLRGPSSIYGRIRAADDKTAGLRFGHIRAPRKARAGANVSQMHYARKGIVTPEMAFIAVRENARLAELREVYAKAGYLKRMGRSAPGCCAESTRASRGCSCRSTGRSPCRRPSGSTRNSNR